MNPDDYNEKESTNTKFNMSGKKELTDSLLSDLVSPTEFLSEDELSLESIADESSSSKYEDFDFDINKDDEDLLPSKVRNAVVGKGLHGSRQERKNLVSQYTQIMAPVEDDDDEYDDDKKLGFWARMKEKRRLKKEEKFGRNTDYDDFPMDGYDDDDDGDFEDEPGYSSEDYEDGYLEDGDSAPIEETVLEAQDEAHEDLHSEFSDITHAHKPDHLDDALFSGGENQYEKLADAKSEAREDEPLGETSQFNLPGTAEFNLDDYRKKEYITNEMLVNVGASGAVSENTTKSKKRDLLYAEDELPDDKREARETSFVEYTDPAQKLTRQTWLNENLKSTAKKHRLLLLLSLASLVLTMPLFVVSFTRIGFLNYTTNPKPFILLHMLTLFVSALIMLPQLINGFSQILKGHANVYTALDFGLLAAFIQMFMLFAKPDGLTDLKINLFNLPLILSMLFLNYGILMRWRYAKTNFNVASSKRDLYSAEFMEKQRFESQIIKLTGNPDAVVIGSRKTKFFERFFELSLHEADTPYHASVNRAFYGSGIIVAFVVFFVSLMFAKPFAQSLSLLICLLSLVSLFSAELASSLPLHKIAKRINSKNAFISNTNAVHDLGECSSIILHTKDLFPKGTITLNGIRAFKGARIDEAIVDAGSVLYQTGDALAPLFLDIIRNKKTMLSKLDGAEYDPGLGIVAWTEGQRILVGGSGLMHKFKIATPDKAYEDVHKADGSELVYVARAGKLSAMFVVKYKTNPEIANYVKQISDSGVDLIIETADQNLSKKKLSSLFEIPIDKIFLLPEKAVEIYREVSGTMNTAPALGGHNGTIYGYLSMLVSGIKMAPLLSIFKFIQILTMVLGILAIVFVGLFGSAFPGVSQITPFTVISIQLVSLILIALINKIRRI